MAEQKLDVDLPGGVFSQTLASLPVWARLAVVLVGVVGPATVLAGYVVRELLELHKGDVRELRARTAGIETSLRMHDEHDRQANERVGSALDALVGLSVAQCVNGADSHEARSRCLDAQRRHRLDGEALPLSPGWSDASSGGAR